MPWSIKYFEPHFDRFLTSLTPYQQAVAIAAIETVLTMNGIEICAGPWGKPLGRGLYEFRINSSLASLRRRTGTQPPASKSEAKALIRIFCTFHGSRTVLLLHGYDKGRDSSRRRQAREIARARRILRKYIEHKG